MVERCTEHAAVSCMLTSLRSSIPDAIAWTVARVVSVSNS
jgi:hypothetical protein